MQRSLVLLGTAALVLATACSPGASGKATSSGRLPASCAKSPLPVLDGATNCESNGEQTSYSISNDFPSVMTYYNTYFKNNGWTREDDSKTGDVSVWGKDRQKGSVALSKDGTKTKVIVGIITFAN